MRLAKIPDCTTQRAQGIAQQARPAGSAGVESASDAGVAHPFRHAQQGLRGDPFAALHRGVADRIISAGAFAAPDAAMQDQSAMELAKHHASGRRRVRRRPDGNRVAIADGGIHAGAAGAENDARALLEKGGDDFLRLGHEGDRFWMEKV